MSISINEMGHQIDLPDQLIMDEVLTRLPVRSLFRFKSVCKLWNAAVSSAQFAKAHLDKQRFNSLSNSNPKWIFFQDRQKSYLLNYEAYDDDPGCVISVREVLNDHLNGAEADPVGSSCGLVCLFMQDSQFCLFNPSLCLWRTIVNPVPFFTSDLIIFRGFGYASPIDDFKLVLGFRGQLEGQSPMIYVFTLRSNTWRAIEGGDHFDIIARSPVYYKGILVNERLHWWITPTGSNNDGRIFAFDLVHEVTQEILITELLGSKAPDMFGSSESSGISVMGGCLCLSVFREKNKVDIWMLKQYGDRNSWVKLYHLHVPGCYEYNCAEFFGLTKTGRFVMRCWSALPDGRFLWDVILLTNPDQSHPRFHPIWVDGPISSIETYVESLVSPFGLGTPTLREMEGEVGDTEERIMEKYYCTL